MEMGCASFMAVMERTLQEQPAVVRPADQMVSTEKGHQAKESGTEDYQEKVGKEARCSG